jgi:hypothetical protein
MGHERFAACRARGHVVSLNDALTRLAAVKPLFAVTLSSKSREEHGDVGFQGRSAHIRD